LRIPFEGCWLLYPPAFTVVSLGNDLPLHAHGSRWMDEATRRTLRARMG
jgi:hypothetical protein